MPTKTAFFALAAATFSSAGASAAVLAGPSGAGQSFVSSEVVARADASASEFVRSTVALGENGQALASGLADGTFVGAIANLQSLFVEDVLHIAGTSHDVRNGSSAVPAFFHEVRTTIDIASSGTFSVFVADDVTDADYDRALLSSLEITDADGNTVDISVELAALSADPTARRLEIELGPGVYQTLLGAGSADGGDREFQLRSSVVSGPTPSAALAGLVGLGGLLLRRRAQG